MTGTLPGPNDVHCVTIGTTATDPGAAAIPIPARVRLGYPEIEITGAPLHRCVDVRAEDINQDTRTVRIAVSSELPVERWFGFEILDHAPASVLMGRLANRAPLLLGHDTDRHIGVVERAWLEDKRLRADVRFSRNPEADAVFKDIVDKIRGKISVGYRVHKAVLEKTEGNDDTYRVMSWEPMEVSVVSVPADDSVGVGRQLSPLPNMSAPNATPASQPATQTRSSEVAAPPPQAAAQPSGPAAPAVQVVSESTDSARIARFGQAHPEHQAAAMRAIGRGSSFLEFLDGLSPVPSPSATPSGRSAEDPNLGMSPREIGRFSILRAISAIAFEGGLTGIEREASEAFAQKFRIKSNDRSFFVPFDVQRSFVSSVRADLAAGTGSLGGATVQTDVLASEFIELLRARLISTMLGVRTMFGLQGNVSIPAQTAGATGAWLTEGGPITPSAQTFGQVPLSPKRYGAATAYSRQLVVQSSIDVEAFVRMDLAAVTARGFDLAVIAGPGTGGAPTGILSTSGIGTVTFGGAATWAKVLEFETAVATANADYGNLAYLSTPATRGKWKNIPKVAAPANTGGFLWQDSGFVPVMPAAGSSPTPDAPPIGLVNGYRAIASTIVPTNRVIFGNFSDAILGMWIPLEIVVDPYSLSLNHQVRVVVNALGDVAVRHAAAFAASTDTGAA